MAYDAAGKWQPENVSVADNVDKITSQDSALMQRAATTGARAANKRGLANSSIAVGAAQEEVLKAATPIATADAANTTSTNIADANMRGQKEMQQVDVQAQSDRLAAQLGSNAALQAAQLAAQKEMQGLQLTSQEKQQVADLAAAKERLGMQLTSTDALQAKDIAAQKERLDAQLGSTAALQSADLKAAMERLQTQAGATAALQSADIAAQGARQTEALASQKDIAEKNIAAQLTMNASGQTTEQRIAQMNIAGQDRERAAALAASYQQTYAQMYESIVSNKDLPAATRQAYLQHAQATLDSNLSLLEQMFGIDLQWGTSGGTAAATAANPGTGLLGSGANLRMAAV